MKLQEKYKRLVRLFFSTVLICVNTGIYGYLWINYINDTIWSPFYRKGNWAVIGFYFLLLFFFMKMYGGFKVGFYERGKLIFSQIFSLVITNLFIYFFIVVLSKGFFVPTLLIGATIFQVVVIFTWSIIFMHIYTRFFPPRRMLFITGNRSDQKLLEKMNIRDDKFIVEETVSYEEKFETLQKMILDYEGVIVGDMPSHARNQILKYCFLENVRTYSVPKISDVLIRSSSELTLFDTQLLLSRNEGLLVEQQFMKRFLDIVFSFVACVITLPIFVLIAIAIKLEDGGPVFYKQTRLTLNGREFEIYKFRTMVQNAEKLSGPRLAGKNDPRILKVGKLLRATRLDELPQIYNILKGEMSFVGPRPERPELASEIEKEIPEFRYRLKTKAGLTGYAQIYGKYNTTSYDKLKLDLTYIRNYSVWLDLKLMILTPKIMLMKESTEGVDEEN